jgi:hypothetical protein
MRRIISHMSSAGRALRRVLSIRVAVADDLCCIVPDRRTFERREWWSAGSVVNEQR